jgi:hypothetical protein
MTYTTFFCSIENQPHGAYQYGSLGSTTGDVGFVANKLVMSKVSV